MSRVLLFAFLAGGLVMVSGWSAAPPGSKADEPKTPVVSRSPVQALLQPMNFKGLDAPKTPLSEVLDALAKASGVAISVNERAFKAEAVNNVLTTQVTEERPLPPMRSTLARVLQTVLDRIPVPSGATYMVREDGIEVTTRQAQSTEVSTQREEVALKPNPPGSVVPVPAPVPAAPAQNNPGGLGFPPLAANEEEVKKIQIPVVSVALEKQPFDEAVRQIRAQANINMVLDPALGEKSRTPLTITMLNAPLDSAVLVLTELAELDFVWLDNIFFVTNKEKAERLKNKWPNRRGGGLFSPGSGNAAAAGGM